VPDFCEVAGKIKITKIVKNTEKDEEFILLFEMNHTDQSRIRILNL
jgi:hypothetical protein